MRRCSMQQFPVMRRARKLQINWLCVYRAKGGCGKLATWKLAEGAAIEIEVLLAAPISLGGFHLPSSFLAAILNCQQSQSRRKRKALHGASGIPSCHPSQSSGLRPFSLSSLALETHRHVRLQPPSWSHHRLLLHGAEPRDGRAPESSPIGRTCNLDSPYLEPQSSPARSPAWRLCMGVSYHPAER